MTEFPKEKQDKINLSHITWIIGTWKKKTLEEELEEYWFPQMEDAIAGWFRWKKENEIFLYEFMLLQQIADSLVLKIKHFDGNLVGWEEKDKWTEYVAWDSKQNELYLRATDSKHTAWMVYKKQDSNLMVTFYDESKKKKDELVFHSSS